MLINLKPKARSGSCRQRGHGRLQAARRQGARRHALHAAGAGSDHRFGPVSPRSTSSSLEIGQRHRIRRTWAPSWWTGCAAAGAARRDERRRLQGLRRRTSRSTATPPRAFGITAATIDDALYSAFGQRIVSTIFTQSNQYRVMLEAMPDFRWPRRRSLGCLQLPTGGGKQVPLSAIAASKRAHRAAAINRVGQYPATISFNTRARRVAGPRRSTPSVRPPRRPACRVMH
jgi:hypothetical protein